MINFATAAMAALVLANNPGISKEVEEAVSLAELPDAVRTTILSEAGSYPIAEIEKITFEGKIFYEAEWIVGENEVEVTVSPDGTVLGRDTEPLDDDDDDDDDDDEDDDEK